MTERSAATRTEQTITEPTITEQTITAGAVVTPESVHSPGWVRVREGRIAAVGAGAPPPDAAAPDTPATAPDTLDLGPAILAPGFVDQHAPGGGGVSVADGPDAARAVLATHLAHGTTSMVASLTTDTIAHLTGQVAALAPLVAAGELVGTHLEGPWLAGAHCGAHDPHLLVDPTPQDVDALLAAGEGTVAMVTLATERAGGLAAVRQLAAERVLVAVGHSDATYAEAHAAIDAGVRVATHLFNSERAIHQREPGLILALLEREETFVELIADGVHVHPAILRHAARAKPGRHALISDAMAAAGSGDGTYRLGPLTVEVRDGVARLISGGAIAGSTLTLDRAVRVAVSSVGLDLVDAVRAASTTPADILGRPDLGRIAPGARADLVALDADLRVLRVMRQGRWVMG